MTNLKCVEFDNLLNFEFLNQCCLQMMQKHDKLAGKHIVLFYLASNKKSITMLHNCSTNRISCSHKFFLEYKLICYNEKIWKIWKKGMLNSEMIWKIWKISVLVIIRPKETSSPSHLLLLRFILLPTILHHLLLSPSCPPPPPPPPLTDISNVVFQTLRFEKVRGKSTGKCNV